MYDHLVLEFWDEVVSILAQEGVPEPKARQEISSYLRDLAQQDATSAVYHFGEQYAADSILERIGRKRVNSGKRAS